MEPGQITWPFSTDPEAATSSLLGLRNYTEYFLSPGCYRAFCRNCGSTLLWRCEKEPEEVGITTGTIDEDLLIGEKIGCHCPGQERKGLEVGKALCEPVAGHLWFENAV